MILSIEVPLGDLEIDKFYVGAVGTSVWIF